MNFRRFSGKIHLWLGLPGALLFFFICITGSLFVYSDEIMDLYQKPYQHVTQASTRVTVEQMIDTVQANFPRHRISYLIAYKDPSRSVKFLASTREDGLRYIFVDPYTSKIVGTDRSIQFFYIVAHLHGMLLWHGVGDWIVAIATIFFLIALVSGLIITWPRKMSRRGWKQVLSFRLRVPTKRLIYDSHKVLGMYSLVLLTLLTLTGIFIAFKPLANGLSRAFGGNPDFDFNISHPLDSLRSVLPLDKTLDKYMSKPGIDQVRLGLFQLENWSVFPIAAASEISILTHRGDFQIIDRYTGEELNSPAIIRDYEVGNWVMRLHTGQWWSALGKFLTFLAGLIGSFLSVTGIVVWWNKTYGKSKG